MKRINRRAPTRNLKTRVVVVTEGKVTEPRYLRVFEQLHGSESFEVVPIGIGRDPRAVVRRAISESRKADRDGVTGSDSFWAMFDRDDHAHFDEAVRDAKANEVGLAVSNPCFELWAVLHYEDRRAPAYRRDCQARLAQLSEAYARGGKEFTDKDAIRDGYDNAVDRARRLLGTQERGPMPNPSTTVHRLTEFIRGQKDAT